MRTTLLVTCALFAAVVAVPGVAMADHLPCIAGQDKGGNSGIGWGEHHYFDAGYCVEYVDSLYDGPNVCEPVESYVSC